MIRSEPLQSGAHFDGVMTKPEPGVVKHEPSTKRPIKWREVVELLEPPIELSGGTPASVQRGREAPAVAAATTPDADVNSVLAGQAGTPMRPHAAVPTHGDDDAVDRTPDALAISPMLGPKLQSTPTAAPQVSPSEPRSDEVARGLFGRVTESPDHKRRRVPGSVPSGTHVHDERVAGGK